MVRFLLALAIVSIAISATGFPDEEYISYGCHGGFSGGGSSTAILRDGRIYRSQRPTYQSELTESHIGNDPDAAKDLFLASERVDFLGSPTPKPKSFDCVIAKRIAGHTYGISLDQENPPEAVQALARLFIKLLVSPEGRMQ